MEKNDPRKPADKERNKGTIEGSEAPPDAPGVDPSTGSPTLAKQGEPVDAVHAVPPGKRTLEGTEEEVHPKQVADEPDDDDDEAKVKPTPSQQQPPPKQAPPIKPTPPKGKK